MSVFSSSGTCGSIDAWSRSNWRWHGWSLHGSTIPHAMEAGLIRIVAIKFLQAVPVILIISVLAFLLLSLLPGAIPLSSSPASRPRPRQSKMSAGSLGSIARSSNNWRSGCSIWRRGNFGSSLILNQSVLSAVGERLPVTLSLAALSISFTIPVGVFLGSTRRLLPARQPPWIDTFVMTVALLGVSIPAFWIAILGVILFSVQLGWVPSSGFVPISEGIGPWFASIVLPALILSLFQIGFLARMTRSRPCSTC